MKNDILDFFITSYVDDILVFSKTFQKYKKHVKTVLAFLQGDGLQLDIDKYEFKIYETEYLSLIMQSTFPDGCPRCVKMYFTKTSAIDSWESFQSVKDV